MNKERSGFSRLNFEAKNVQSIKLLEQRNRGAAESSILAELSWQGSDPMTTADLHRVRPEIEHHLEMYVPSNKKGYQWSLQIERQAQSPSGWRVWLEAVLVNPAALAEQVRNALN